MRSLTWLIALSAVFAAAAGSLPASAGLNIDAPASYTPGDLIVLTLTGDSEGNTAPVVSALLTVDPALDRVSSTVGTLLSSNETYSWSQTGVVGTCGGSLASNQCFGVDAIAGAPFGFPNDLLPSTLSTFTFETSDATGDLLFRLDPDGAGFFGLPGTEVVVPLVPEPGTAGLLGLGLLALGGSRRRPTRELP